MRPFLLLILLPLAGCATTTNSPVAQAIADKLAQPQAQAMAGPTPQFNAFFR